MHYLEDVLEAAGVDRYHVMLPITDPYVVHHGALGSFAWVHVQPAQLERARAAIAALAGVEEVYTREEAAVIYGHPADRIGDLSVASDARTALGKSAAKHDLSRSRPGCARTAAGTSRSCRSSSATRSVARTPRATRPGVSSSDLHDLVLNGAA